MSITQTIVDSFHTELTQGIHDFRAAGDTFKMALYGSGASLNEDTTTYTTTGEVSGTGYTAGGETMTSVDPVLSNNKTLLDFADVEFTTLTVSGIQGALIYNSTQTDRAVAILKFASTVSPSAQTLTVIMPGVTSTSAIIRIKKVI